MNVTDKIVGRIGKGVAWLNLLLVALICLDVFFRYLFSETSVWVIDLEWYLFAFILLFGGAWALLEERHVRVDVFYQSYPAHIKRWFDIGGHLLIALPWCLMVVWTTWRYALQSWQIGEGSPDPGGLPARYVIKFAIVLGFLLLLLAILSRTFQLLFRPENESV